MNKQNEFDPRDLVIHFRDLVLYVALRWKSILLVALVGAVLLGGFTFWQDSVVYGASKDVQEIVIPTELDAEGLARVATVQSHRAAYDDLSAYNRYAPMMSIDFTAAHTHRLSYLITGRCGYSAATLYNKALAAHEVYASLVEEDTMLPAYFAELVSVVLTYSSNSDAVDQVFLDVEIVAPDKALADKLVELVKKTVADASETATAMVGTHTGKWVFEEAVVAKSEKVRTRQLDSLKLQKQMKTDLTAAESALTAADRAYLNRLDQQEPDPAHPVPKPTLNVKKTLLGFLLGFALMVLWYAVRYLFCGRVLSENDVAVRHGVVVFGSLAGEEKRCCVNRFLCRWLQDKDSDPVLLARKVALSIEASGMTELYVMGELPAAFDEEFEFNNVNVIAGGNPTDSREGLVDLSESEGALLVAKAGVTTHADLARVLATAKLYECNVLGVVIQK